MQMKISDISIEITEGGLLDGGIGWIVVVQTVQREDVGMSIKGRPLKDSLYLVSMHTLSKATYLVGKRREINRDGNKKGVIERWENKVLCNCSEESISS